MAPRRRGRTGRRPGPNRPQTAKYAFAMACPVGLSHVQFAQLAIDAARPLRVVRVSISYASSGFPVICQLVLYANGGEVVAESSPITVGRDTVRQSVSVPRVTDYHLPAQTESIFSVKVLNPRGGSTDAVTASGNVVVQYKSTTTCVIIKPTMG